MIRGWNVAVTLALDRPYGIKRVPVCTGTCLIQVAQWSTENKKDIKIQINWVAVPKFRRLLAGFSSQRPASEPMILPLRINWHWDSFFSQCFAFHLSGSIPHCCTLIQSATIYAMSAQPVARGPLVARNTVSCCPQGRYKVLGPLLDHGAI